MYKVENEKANLYFLSYRKNKLEVGNMLKLKKEKEYVSDQLYLLFRETYPNVSLKDMGVNSEEEAYLATQLAIWELAMRTGDVQEYSELSLIDSIKEDIGLKNINANVFRKAKNLVNFVENFSYYDNTEIQLVPMLILENDKVKKEPISKQNDILLGPYSYKVQAGILTNVEIEITDQDGNDIGGQVTDVNGTEIKDLIEQKEFYVKVPNICDKVKGKIKVEVKRLTPRIYTDQNSDYVVNTYQDNTMEEEFKMNIGRK